MGRVGLMTILLFMCVVEVVDTLNVLTPFFGIPSSNA
jgi:hypothetical protein